MRIILLSAFCFLCLSVSIFAQADRFAYAITDNATEGNSWSMLRKIDLQKNTFSDVMLNGRDVNTPVYDAATSQLTTDMKNGSPVFQPGLPPLLLIKNQTGFIIRRC